MNKIALIFAISQNNVIGTHDPKNPLPWRLPKDMNYFKKRTIGNGENIVVMGRKTWDTIPEKYRPLDGRINIVLSRSLDYVHPDVIVLASTQQLMDYISSASWCEKVFIAGGLEIYRQCMEEAEELFLTRVHAEVVGDVIFDDLDLSTWKLDSSEEHPADEKNKYALTFEKYTKMR